MSSASPSSPVRTPASREDDGRDALQAALLDLCRRNPEAGFARLHSEYLPLVWALCLRVLGSRAWAEDACQECFIRIWRGLPAFRGESRLSTWIWTVSHRCVTSLALRESRGERRAANCEDALELEDRLADNGPDPAGQLETRDLLQRLLAELNPNQRSAITLYYMQELSIAEVSAITGQSEGAVRVTLHRARQRLAGAAQHLERT